MTAASCNRPESHPLDKLGTVRMRVKDQALNLWVADEEPERERGLMEVTGDEMKPLRDGAERGMIFVFDHDDELSFWMKNTIIPLDIAYLTREGQVTAVHTMAPLDDRTGVYTSHGLARYAIEVRGGLLQRLGLRRGDTVEIPDSLRQK